MVRRSSTYSGSCTSNFGFSAMISRSSSSEPDQATATALPGGGHLRVDAEVALAIEGAGADEVHAGLADADLDRRAVRHQVTHVARDRLRLRRRPRQAEDAPQDRKSTRLNSS